MRVIWIKEGKEVMTITYFYWNIIGVSMFEERRILLSILIDRITILILELHRH